MESPDEAGHSGDIKAKIKAIEDFDSKVVGTVLRGIKKFKDFSILLLPDHATPISVKSHTGEPVPFAIYRNARDSLKRVSRNSIQRKHGKKVKAFSENICKSKYALIFDKGHKLMDYFIRGKK